MKRLDQAGSHIVAIAVGVLVIGVIAFAGYTVSQRDNDNKADTNTQTTVSQSDSINTAADLDKASAQLDSSSNQVDSNLNDSSLDADMNDML